VTITRFADVRAAFRVLRSERVLKVVKVVKALSELVDAWALPMSERETAVFWASLGYENFVVCLG
jgi:hypothetical protein